MHIDKDHNELSKDPELLWGSYSNENDLPFWADYEQILEEAKLIQRTFIPTTLPTLADSLALVHGDVFLECKITPQQKKEFRKLVRRQRNGISLPMRIIAPIFGFTLFTIYQASGALLFIGLDQLIAIGASLGGIYSAGTLIEDNHYVNKKQGALLATQIKLKGEEIIVGGVNKVIDLRYVDHLKHHDIGVSLIPYREKQWKTTQPILVIPKYLEEFDKVVKYIEEVIAKYRN